MVTKFYHCRCLRYWYQTYSPKTHQQTVAQVNANWSSAIIQCKITLPHVHSMRNSMHLNWTSTTNASCQNLFVYNCTAGTEAELIQVIGPENLSDLLRTTMISLNLKPCKLTDLPLDLHIQIFSHLQPYDILQASQVLMKLHSFMNHNSFPQTRHAKRCIWLRSNERCGCMLYIASV